MLFIRNMISIRPAIASDAEQLLGIYSPHVSEGTATFEEVVPTVSEFIRRIDFIQSQHLWIVAEEHGVILSYAYASPHRARASYAPTCETSIYTLPSAQGRGIGHWLYSTLLDCLTLMGYNAALGVITFPNPASESFHAKLGFERIVVHPRIGFKHGQWHDTIWYRKNLQSKQNPDFQRRSFSSIQNEEEVKQLFSQSR